MEDRRIRPGPPLPASSAGLFGKLPARGDFVRAGLPGSFIAPWDDWLQTVIADSRVRLGEDWRAVWLEAPVWRFVLPAGACGPGAVLGLMLPSVDRVGRYFPLTLAAVYAENTPADDVWLDAAEQLGRAALELDMTPEQIMARLPPPPAAQVSAPGAWWTEGGPRVAPLRWALPSLPDAPRFARMLGALATEIDA